MTINFITDIKTEKSLIGVISWEEQSDVNYTGIRKMRGMLLLVVKLFNPSAEHPTWEVQNEVDAFLQSEKAEQLLEAYNIGYTGNDLPMNKAGADTWIVHINISAQREQEEQPGAAEWANSRGVPTNARLF